MKNTTPSTSQLAFSCPHCGVYTSQTWYDMYANLTESKDQLPVVYREDLVEWVKSQEMPEANQQEMIRWAEKVTSGEPFLDKFDSSKYVWFVMPTMHVSVCFTCNSAALWLGDKLIHPNYNTTVLPNNDLSEDIKKDFREAGAIVDKSPRGATAILRLALQKLCKQLNLPGKKIDDDIKALVAGGLDVRIQKSLDLVRVIGNNAVHPGQLDIRDDVATATKLFELINLIADRLITHPKEIDKLYEEKVPESAKQAIVKRDGNK